MQADPAPDGLATPRPAAAPAPLPRYLQPQPAPLGATWQAPLPPDAVGRPARRMPTADDAPGRTPGTPSAPVAMSSATEAVAALTPLAPPAPPPKATVPAATPSHPPPSATPPAATPTQDKKADAKSPGDKKADNGKDDKKQDKKAAAKPGGPGEARDKPAGKGEADGKDKGKTAKGAAAGGLAGRLEGDGEEQPEGEVEPDPDRPSEDTGLAVPTSFDAEALEMEWQADAELPADVLPRREGSAARPAEPKKKDEGKRAPGPATHPSAPDSDPQAVDAAREAARSAYADLHREAHREQAALAAETGQVAAWMTHRYGLTADTVTQQHVEGISQLDAQSDRLCEEADAQASQAQFALQSSFLDAGTSLQRAANSAWGAINANDAAASAMITANVGTLERSHNARFAKETGRASAALKTTLDSIQKWSDQRATRYPIQGASSALQGAKNERYQPRIPPLAKKQIDELGKHNTEVMKAWTSTSSTTLCNAGCGYRGGLDSNRKQTFDAGRKSVGKALKQAKKGLATQFAAAQLNLRQMRAALLHQLRAQQRAARSRLTAQARAVLGGALRGAKGAVGSVHGAARSALPGYWRSVHGFGQNLRATGLSGGAAAVRRLAQTGPGPLQRGLAATGASVRERSAGSRERFEADQTQQQDDLATSRSTQVDATLQGMSQAATGGEQQQGERIAAFAKSAVQLRDSVTAAAQSCMAAPQKLFKESLAKSQAQAQASLDGVFTGVQPKPPPGNPDGKDGGGEACTSCSKDSPGSDGKKGSGDGPKGITGQCDEEVKQLEQSAKADELFKPALDNMGAKVASLLDKHGNDVHAAFRGAFAGSVKEEAVTGGLHGLTAPQGHALDVKDHPGAINKGRTLTWELGWYLGVNSDDYAAAIKYLAGDAVGGAKAELKASMHWYNDEESRIESTMRNLSPTEAAELARSDPALKDKVRDALDGTDLKVFDALLQGDAATADALRMKDKIDDARREGDADAVHAAEAEYTSMRGGDWNSRDLEERSELGEMSPEQREQEEDKHRAAVAKALGKMVPDADVAQAAGPNGVAAMSDEERAAAYVTRDIQVYVGGGEGAPPEPVTMSITGANKDLATAILLHGNKSVEAQAARLGVEIERKGDDPKALNVDTAVFDERFTPDNPQAGPKEKADNEARRAQARDKRAQILLLAGQKYAGAEAPPKDFKPDAARPLDDPRVAEAREKLGAKFTDRFGEDKLGADLVKGLMKDERPSATTNSLAMQHAMYSHWGTNEELMFRFSERMTRVEIEQMRTQFRTDTGKDLDAEMGLFGKGPFFSELSGDDRLRMERAMLGVPVNDKEKLEAAVFAIQQQKRETGLLGKFLASGSDGEKSMEATEQNLYQAAGVKPGDFTVEGHLKGGGLFDNGGNYTGKDKDRFVSGTANALQVAQNYQAVIDSYADIATTGIAILGAIAAAAITVATGGAAGPLIAAAVVAGLASMGANYAIKGGRYGWEQAAVDLGMTAVQAVTAGVGAQLGAAAQVASKGAQAATQASRMITSLARIFTGNPVVDQIIIGAITSSIGTLGSTALQEQTWEKGPGHAVGALFEALLKGALTGAATAAVSQAIEVGAGLGPKLQALSAEGGPAAALRAVALRGAGRALIAGTGGMVGKGTEILFDKATGKFHGRGEDALWEVGKAGLHSAVQGFGEGSSEAVGQRFHNASMQRLEADISAERKGRGMEPLEPRALTEAAHDLALLNLAGGNDGLARAIHLDHVATHGGIHATVATMHPEPVVLDSMRAELLRHVPPELHAGFGEVPIRVLPEAEFRALTRSESGSVVTLIHDGKPSVVIREGTPISRLADEGPHLMQAHEGPARARVARLDEAALAHWDSLPVEAQLDLYRNKVGLEIEAHEQIARSTDEAVARGELDPRQAALEQARNDTTLRNLRERLVEVEAIGPQQRAAMESGAAAKPQYLEQPARLFSKESAPRANAGFSTEEIQAVRQQHEGEHEHDARPARPGETEEPHPTVPHEPPESTDGKRLFDRTQQQVDEQQARMDRGNTFNNEQEVRHPHNEVYIDIGSNGKRVRVDSYVPGEEIISRKYTQLAELSEAHAIGYINELIEKYPRGAVISDVPSNHANGLAGRTLQGEYVLQVAEQLTPVPREVLQNAHNAGVTIRDPEGRVYSLEHPEGSGRPGLRASASEPEQHAAEMQQALLRHVPEALHAVLGDTVIEVLPEHTYNRQFGSEHSGAVTLMQDGRPYVVMREGMPISRLADEGPHLVQAHDETTSARVAMHDEAEMRRWNSLSVERQTELYRNKLELEILAHEQIGRSLQEESPQGLDEQHQRDFEAGRNRNTLDNLRARLTELGEITSAGAARTPAQADTLNERLSQPARLFSKEASPKMEQRPVVFEPFSGPSLKSAQELQQRHPGAEVVTSEASRPPPASEVEHFEAGGGRFIGERFGESLPDNSVDQMHVRFPLPHSKGSEMAIGPHQMAAHPGKNIFEVAMAMQAGIESITNLGPHALRTLKPGATMEVVFHEGEIAGELAKLQGRVWTDPGTGERFRLEAVGPAQRQQRSEVAPHSGHGLIEMGVDLTEVNVVKLRKVREGAPAGEPPPSSSSNPTASSAARAPSEQERAEGRSGRAGRKQQERLERNQRAEQRQLKTEREAAQRQAMQERQASAAIETAARRAAVEEGRVGPGEDLHQRIGAVAAALDVPVDQLARAIRHFTDDLGGSGRRLDAQEVIDSLRNRVRDGQPPRYGELETWVAQSVLEQNALAVQMMREHIAQVKPDAVLGVKRGGAFLAEMLSRGVSGFPETVQVPKALIQRPGKADIELRIPHLETEIRARIAAGQSTFAIVDFYMGGVFAGELQSMIRRIVATRPDVRFEVMWMRETHGFERLALHPERPNPMKPTREDLERGVVFTGRLHDGKLLLQGPGVLLPGLKGTGDNLVQLRATEFPVDLVLGDDMNKVMAATATDPIRIFDRHGSIVNEIPAGTPDPSTGQPLRTTKDILVRLIEDPGFNDEDREGK
ncbi:hypothetical protein ASE08_04925 [Rhizobacter sp. Root16D2]|nr:hypothetical protein ASC88_23345 [Rhizobacter sp. Root29]KQW14220.1 hypothetical protein ASC98_16385 [Rhizobacter sp. Root1238]KRB18586.1 hypothetical protein ASE08_04925 [Rhizobacter sp. Root16D2]